MAITTSAEFISLRCRQRVRQSVRSTLTAARKRRAGQGTAAWYQPGSDLGEFVDMDDVDPPTVFARGAGRSTSAPPLEVERGALRYQEIGLNGAVWQCAHHFIQAVQGATDTRRRFRESSCLISSCHWFGTAQEKRHADPSVARPPAIKSFQARSGTSHSERQGGSRQGGSL